MRSAPTVHGALVFACVLRGLATRRAIAHDLDLRPGRVGRILVRLERAGVIFRCDGSWRMVQPLHLAALANPDQRDQDVPPP